MKYLDLLLPADICIIWLSSSSFLSAQIHSNTHPRSICCWFLCFLHDLPVSVATQRCQVEALRKPTPKISWAASRSFRTVAVGAVGIVALRPPQLSKSVSKVMGSSPDGDSTITGTWKREQGWLPVLPKNVRVSKLWIDFTGSDWDSQIWVEWPLVSQVRPWTCDTNGEWE